MTDSYSITTTRGNDAATVVSAPVFIAWVHEYLDNLRFCEVAEPRSIAHANVLAEGRIKWNAVLDALGKLNPDLYAEAVHSWKPLRSYDPDDWSN